MGIKEFLESTPPEKIAELTKQNPSIRTIFLNYGIRDTAYAYRKFNEYCTTYKISLEEIKEKAQYVSGNRIPTHLLLTENSPHKLNKNRLIKEKILDDKCYNEGCNITSTWLGNPITLEIDHIDGNPNNHSPNNLRLLCPNCHSQQPTSNRRKTFPPRKIIIHTCNRCEKEISNGAQMCVTCSNTSRKQTQEREDWPPMEEIASMIRKSSFDAVGKQLNISGSGLRKYLKRFGKDPKTIKK